MDVLLEPLNFLSMQPSTLSYFQSPVSKQFVTPLIPLALFATFLFNKLLASGKIVVFLRQNWQTIYSFQRNLIFPSQKPNKEGGNFHRFHLLNDLHHLFTYNNINISAKIGHPVYLNGPQNKWQVCLLFWWWGRKSIQKHTLYPLFHSYASSYC